MKKRLLPKISTTIMALTLTIYAGTTSFTTAAYAQGASANSSPAVVTVYGNSQIKVKPDLVRIIITVSTREGKSVAEVMALNKQTTEKVIAKIRSLGIPADDVKPLTMSVIDKAKERHSKLSFTSPPDANFQVAHMIEIVLHDIANSGKTIGDILAIDDAKLHSLTWDINNRQASEDKALIQAVSDAKHRAGLYASASGVKLSRIMSILDQEDKNNSSALSYADENYPDISRKNYNDLPIFPPEFITINSRVHMIWEIVP